MKTAPQIYLERLEETHYRPVILRGLEAVGFFEEIKPGAKVFLKPNLTFPVYRPGVMTSFECLKAVTEILSERGYRVWIGEADSGGYNRFSIDEVFQQIGVYDLAAKTGAKAVNVSFTDPIHLECRRGIRQLNVPVPKLLFQEMDAFITLPVPKIHMNTLVSMSIKNQWGCIQEPSERLKLHPYFSEVMYEINRSLPPAYSIIDGRFGLNGSGPMRGDAVELGWVMVGDDLVAADRICCRLMQVDENKVNHLNYFRRRGWWSDVESIQLNQPWKPFLKEKFYLKRAWTDWPGWFCFHNALLAWLGYHSPLAGILHKLLYLFRKPFYDYESERAKLRTPEN